MGIKKASFRSILASQSCFLRRSFSVWMPSILKCCFSTKLFRALKLITGYCPPCFLEVRVKLCFLYMHYFFYCHFLEQFGYLLQDQMCLLYSVYSGDNVVLQVDVGFRCFSHSDDHCLQFKSLRALLFQGCCLISYFYQLSWRGILGNTCALAQLVRFIIVQVIWQVCPAHSLTHWVWCSTLRTGPWESCPPWVTPAWGSRLTLTLRFYVCALLYCESVTMLYSESVVVMLYYESMVVLYSDGRG